MTRPARKPARAATLIAAAQAKAHTPDPSPAALDELRAVLAHNDGASRPQRVPAEAAMKMLNELGWPCRSRSAFERMCKRVLGRSYGSR